MSKHLKLKFKKTLKKASYTQADLEYHKEMFKEAKNLFMEEISSLIQKLSPEKQQQLRDVAERNALKQAAAKSKKEKEEEEPKEIEQDIHDPAGADETSLVRTAAASDEDDSTSTTSAKTGELKKLFHRIAEQTHPDKVTANGFSTKEVLRLERVFKESLKAYKDNNWYVLYSIAMDLDIKIDGPTREQVDWIEEDIDKSSKAISQITNRLAWMWYEGTLNTKRLALQDYFKQMYQFDYPGL